MPGNRPSVAANTAAQRSRVRTDFQLAHAIRLRGKTNLTIIAIGSAVRRSLEAAEVLAAENLSLGVIDMHTLKPLEEESVSTAAASSRAPTVEERSTIGSVEAPSRRSLAKVPSVPFIRPGAARRVRADWSARCALRALLVGCRAIDGVACELPSQ
jgi:transketolase C-terminal domain/subunit